MMGNECRQQAMPPPLRVAVLRAITFQAIKGEEPTTAMPAPSPSSLMDWFSTMTLLVMTGKWASVLLSRWKPQMLIPDPRRR